MTALSWWRSWHGAPTDHKWAVIAARAGVKTGIVVATAWALLDYASQQKERGSVIGFDTETFAVFTGFPESEIVAVMQALNDKKVVIDGRLAKWEERQTKREDNSAPRVAQFRARQQNVTQCNADDSNVTQEDGDVTSPSLSLSLSESDSVLRDKDPLDDFISEVQQIVGLVGTANDVKSMTKWYRDGVIIQDVKSCLSWRKEENKGPVKSIAYLSSSVEVARLKRIQQSGGNGKPPIKHNPLNEIPADWHP